MCACLLLFLQLVHWTVTGNVAMCFEKDAKACNAAVSKLCANLKAGSILLRLIDKIPLI